jgi:2-iminobutanoate/2-iminopropanoate deaminase
MKTSKKEIQGLGMPWEKEFGYAQAVKLGNSVWIAGQVGHDNKGDLAEGMEPQMKLAYNNIKKLLAGFDMTMDDVMEEVTYVLDINTAFEASKKLRKEFYSDPMQIASTLVAVNGLVLPGQLIEIKIVAKKPK